MLQELSANLMRAQAVQGQPNHIFFSIKEDSMSVLLE